MRVWMVDSNGSRCPTSPDASGASSRRGNGLGRALRRELSAALVDGVGICCLGAADAGGARTRPLECGGAGAGGTRLRHALRSSRAEHRSAGSSHRSHMGWGERGGRRGVWPRGGAAGRAGADAAPACGAAWLGDRVAAGPGVGGHRVPAAGDHGGPPVGHDRHRAYRRRAAAGVPAAGRHVAGADRRDGHQRRHRGAHSGRAGPVDRVAAGPGLDRGRCGGGLDPRRNSCAAAAAGRNRHAARGCGAAGRARAGSPPHATAHRAPPIRRSSPRSSRRCTRRQQPRQRAPNWWCGRRPRAGSIR